MRHGSLFSGIGGFDLASEWMGWENIFQVEWDEYCQKVLSKNFPKVKRYEDIKKFDGTKYKGTVDIITGGFPCQPFSQAGKRKGTKDDRYLWPEMLRVIKEIKPAFVVGENVAGLLSMEDGKTLEGIFIDLENEGYEIESFIIPACSVGAWHRRDRIWVVAYTNDKRNRTKVRQCNGKREGINTKIGGKVWVSSGNSCKDVPNTKEAMCKQSGNTWARWEGFTNRNWWEAEPNVGRVADGISSRVDRLKGLGNAIVPQVAYEIFKAIEKLQ